jgi:hypothetical protein
MEAWTGKPPFRRGTPEESEAAMRGAHPRPSDFDGRLAPLDDAVARAMHLDPRERPQDASELGRALRAFLSKVDTSDVARSLGDRVREVRTTQAALAPASERHGQRAAFASQAEVGTKTFAAREEALGWTPGQGAGPRTRKIEDRAIEEEAVPADRVETIATRPIETRSPDRPPARRTRGRTVAVGVVLAGLVGLGAGAWRARSTTEGADSLPTPVQPKDHPSAVVVQSSPNEAPSVENTASAPASDPTPSTPPVRSATPGAAPSSNAASVRSGVEHPSGAAATFLGEPGTRVSVDGLPRGACPVRLTLDPGAHDVRFVFDPTGETRGERLTVKAGERVTVRAEFTGASPMIRIHR